MTEQSNHTIGPADYAEPRCPLGGETYASAPASIPVPQRRIIEKMDEYMSRRDYAGAERHLLYWLEEAKLGADARGELMIRGELIGHFRKTGNREAALREVDAALALLKRMDFENSISAGTTYVNSATALSAFGEHERALSLFENARRIYESTPGTAAELLGGLYNNMALDLAALGRYAEAERLYDLAMEKMLGVPGGGLEAAITCLNRADLLEQAGGEETEAQDGADAAGPQDSADAAPQDGAAAPQDSLQGSASAVPQDGAASPQGSLQGSASAVPQGSAAPRRAGEAETDARITALCEEAVRLLKETDAPKDGYYAFVLEKCAPALDHHGFFLDAEELRAESARIYAENAD